MKLERQKSALLRLKKALDIGIKPASNKNPIERLYTKNEIAEIEKTISTLESYIRGDKKQKVRRTKATEVQKEDPFEIQIYSVKYGYQKKSDRKNAKGKKKKGLKKIKTMTLIQTVKNRPGLITSYKNGLMGISPKTHVFKMVKVESNNY